MLTGTTPSWRAVVFIQLGVYVKLMLLSGPDIERVNALVNVKFYAIASLKMIVTVFDVSIVADVIIGSTAVDVLCRK